MNHFTSYTEIDFSNGKNDRFVALTYLGCAGFKIRSADQVIMIDPFFSYLPLWKTLFPFKHDIKEIKSQLKDSSNIKAILFSHTHYDHVADFPYIYEHHLNKAEIKIIGNQNIQTVMNIIDPQKKSTFINGESSSWIELIPGCIRLLPICANHAPQLGPFQLFSGNLKRNTLPNKTGQWKGGQVLAYLIDFLDQDGKTPLRIFLSGSADLASKELLSEIESSGKGVDVAILSFALHDKIKSYPQQVIESLRPRETILSHWDNFLKPRNEVKNKNLVLKGKTIDAFQFFFQTSPFHLWMESLKSSINFFENICEFSLRENF